MGSLTRHSNPTLDDKLRFPELRDNANFFKHWSFVTMVFGRNSQKLSNDTVPLRYLGI
jgi:hypothetical protein